MSMTVGLAVAQPASASLWGAGFYNFGSVGIGTITEWSNPPGYQYITYPRQWAQLNNVKGFYVGPGWCVDMYYSWNGPWYYQWTVRQGYHSIAYASITNAGAFPYRC
jgi:hypothetical protein